MVPDSIFPDEGSSATTPSRAHVDRRDVEQRDRSNLRAGIAASALAVVIVLVAAGN